MTTSPAIRAQTSGSAHKPELRPTSDIVRRTSQFTSVLFSGLFAGFLTGVLILEASLRGYPASVYTQVRLVESWSVLAPPSDWVSVRDRWQIAHLLRTISAVMAFAVLAAAGTVARKQRRTDQYPAAA
ncbi:MAG: hypothetical protein ACRDUT_04525 [Mycobacterium sp.]